MRALSFCGEQSGLRRSRLAGAVLVVVAALLVAGCSSPHAAVHSASTGRPSASARRAPTSTPPAPPPDPLVGMTLQQRVGQLFMVGTAATVAEADSLSAVANLHVGSVFLAGRSHAGVAATAAVVAQFRALVGPASTDGIGLLVATDQEGGDVQVLQGPGFSAIPSALVQGTMAPMALQADASVWGNELTASGVNMDLAPVVDLIASPAAAASNPPIGAFDREYGFDPATITQHADAFRAGMTAAGVIPVIKHFPGLGYVSRNTDTSSGVTDATTTASSQSVDIFASEIADGARCVMVSLATYSKIDPTLPAVFSPTVVTSLLRQRLRFTGVIMSDDLSAPAQVQAWSPADRAVMAIEAGVDLVLVSAVPADAAPMVDAVVTKAQSDPAFAALVDSAARRVIELKAEKP